MKKKKVFWGGIVFILLITIGIGSFLVMSSKPQEMPEIIFMYTRTRPDYSTGDVVFWDNCGNKYWTNDPSVCNLSWKEIYEEFTAGRLDDVLKKKKVCEPEEMYTQYKLLTKVAKNKELELIPESEYFPEVVTDHFSWWGVYANKDKELELIELRSESFTVTYYANDENANKICEWMEEE